MASGYPLAGRAVVFRVAVLVDDRLGRERNDFLAIGMNQRGTEHLMRIGHRWDRAAARQMPAATDP